LAGPRTLVTSPASTSLALAFGLLLAPGIACADAEDPLSFNAGAGLRYDDNVFRLPANADPRSALGKPTKADWIQTASLGVRFDKPYAQQRVQLVAGITDNRYETLGSLNFVSRNYQAAWLWHLTSRLSGTLSADKQQTLNDFADFRGSTRNIRTTETRHADADWWLHGSWHLTGGLAENHQNNSQTFTADDSFVLRSAEAGVKYVAESDNAISLVTRRGHGENPDRSLDPVAQLDTRYEQNETELKLNYQLTGKSTVNGSLARVERKHEHFGARDFAGMTGRADYLWKPFGKLQFGISAGRDIAVFQDATSSYYVNDSLSISPTWQVSAKTTAGLKLDLSRRDYRGAIAPLAASRQDQGRSVGITLGWAPLRSVSISGSLQWERRTSTLSGFEFTDTTAALTAQLTF